MNLRNYLLFVLLIILTMRGSSELYLDTQLEAQPYIEPAVLSAETETVSVIVTAGDSTLAAKNVESSGGQVISDLWLIDAVAATITSSQLEVLAASPEIHSIVQNKETKTSSGWVPYDKTYATDQGWPVAIDVGADLLHEQGSSRDGVSVAVLDTGVFFDPIILGL